MTPDRRLPVLRLLEFVLAAGVPRTASGAPRVIYARAGRIGVATGSCAGSLAEDSALFTAGDVTLTGDGVRAWCFELVSPDSPAADGATVKIARPVELDPAGGWLLRCDRVDFPPAGETPRHTHVGPGIRAMLHGEIRGEIGAETGTYAADQCWWERGPDPVVGRARTDGESAFVRAMVLPVALLGQSSYRAWDAVEAAKPRTMRYRVMVDRVLAQSFP